MPGLIEELRERNETTLDAAKELVRGLMRGHKSDFKLGYSWENAVLAADSMLGEVEKPDGDVGLPPLDLHEVKFYALGFARGMHGALPANETELEAQVRKVSERYALAYAAGRGAGLHEDRDAINPAGLPGVDSIVHATDAVPPEVAAQASMKTCGCGATSVGECAAAVEGRFTSLGQRSNEELRVLGDEEDGDGCTAAQVVLVLREQAAG